MISELSYILSILDSEEVNEKLLNYNQLTREEKDNYLKKAFSQYSKGIINKEETQILDNISYLTDLLISSEKEYYNEKLLEIFLDSIIDYPIIIIDNKRVIFNSYDLTNQFEVLDIQMSSVDTIKSISYQVPQTGENIYIENIGNAVLSKHFFPNNHSSIRYYLNDFELSENDYYTFLEVSKKNNNKKYKTPVFDDERFLADILKGPVLDEGENDFDSSIIRLFGSENIEVYLDEKTREELIVHRYPYYNFICSERFPTDDSYSIKYYINNEEVSINDVENPLEYLKKKNSRKV